MRKLESNEDEIIRNLVGTFEFIMMDKNWMNDEIASLIKVNEIRENYLTSNETINHLDYRAGSSNSKRTETQIYEGVITKVSISSIRRKASTLKKWGELIFKIIRDFKPANCLELGTSLGVSGAYQISALKLNTYGKFTTIEGSEELAKFANKSLNKTLFPRLHCPYW